MTMTPQFKSDMVAVATAAVQEVVEAYRQAVGRQPSPEEWRRLLESVVLPTPGEADGVDDGIVLGVVVTARAAMAEERWR